MRQTFCENLEPRLFLTTTPNDPNYSSEWGLSAINASSAWDTTKGSAATVVADIDTGLDYTHNDLYLNVWINQAEIPAAVKKTLIDTDGDGRITFYDLNAAANKGKVTDVDKNGRIDAADILTRAKYGGWADGVDEDGNGYVDDIVGWDFANNDRNPLDGDGHGTHTAGTIGAIGNNGTGVSGVDWRVSIMAVKIFDDQGNSASDRSIAAAIRYSADEGATVSNNSWGGGGYSTRIYNAIAYAGTKGQLFVVAAGNDASNLDSRYYNDYPSEYALDNILVVGATTSNGSAAYYSNYGAGTVDVFAPGSSVLSTTPGNTYQRMSGTSMATPHVTGAAALMLAANPNLTAAQIKARIIAGADQSAALTGLSASGGELNVANAIANTTGTRFTASTSSGGSGVIYIPIRHRRFFFAFIPDPSVPTDGSGGSTGSGASSGSSAGSSSGSSSSASSSSGSSRSATATATSTTVTSAPVARAAASLAPPAPAAARDLLTDSATATTAIAAAAPSSTDTAQTHSAITAAPVVVARGVFSDRRVSATAAGYEMPPAWSDREGLRRITLPTPDDARPAAAAAAPMQLAMNTAPTPIAQSPSAIPASSYVAAGAPGTVPVLPLGPGDDELPAGATIPPVTAVARHWYVLGTPGRAAAAVATVTAVLAGGVTQFRRAKRARAAAATQDGAEPVEFPLNRH